MRWAVEFGYVEDAGIITIGRIILAILAGHLIPMSLMYGYVHVVKLIIGRTGIVTDAIANMKDNVLTALPLSSIVPKRSQKIHL
jgi:hypothetical protein